MALEKVRDILAVADKNNTSVYAFDAMDADTIYAVIYGAERAGKPVIVMLYPAGKNGADMRIFAETVKAFARDVKVPVGLHLDHCSNFETIVTAIREGFTSVMADGSTLPFEENVAFTKDVVRVARVFDVDVEGELGHVGVGMRSEDYGSDELYTLPEDARCFAEQTGVASLAVAIGSAHGVYIKTPKLAIGRLSEINSATDVPLVLHGGSGIPEDQLKDAFANGINKFNVGTEFFQLNARLHKDVYGSDDKKPMTYIRDGLTDYIAEKVSLCRIQL